LNILASTAAHSLVRPDDKKSIEVARILGIRWGRTFATAATAFSRVLEYRDVARAVIGITSEKLIYALMTQS
jgi:hypothetical protein